LTKPVNDLALFCRVKSLVRLKMLTDELRARSPSVEAVALVNRPDDETCLRPGKILLIDNRAHTSEHVKSALAPRHDITVMDDPMAAVVHAAEEGYELIIIDLDIANIDGLRLCSQLKSLERTRQTPILIIVDRDDPRLMRALDMGVNDYLMRPLDALELLARVSTQIRRCRYAEQLRSNVQASLEMAVTDPLTGLYNRRYMESQTAILVEHATNRGKTLAVVVLDVDHFKSVNDNHGHDVGDRVLQELASRLRSCVRNVDLICRMGGEEFVVVLPDAGMDVALKVAERIRRVVGAKPFTAGPRSGALHVTVSLGVALIESPKDTMEEIVKRADDALYRAKREGRNRVIPNAA
jgi:two-component system cell cycle response regulator